MRHKRSIPRLSVKADHRKALLTNMATSLLDHGQIQTTTARARALVPVVSRLITLAGKDDVHNRRRAAATISNKTVLGKLFTEIAPEFKDRSGGYARIVKSGYRKGDGASMAIVQLLLEKKSTEEKESKKGKKGDRKKAKASLKKEGSKKEKASK